jgi:hypothetical protein
MFSRCFIKPKPLIPMVKLRMPEFNVGIRFQPMGQDTTDEDAMASTHWALIFTPSNDPNWSVRVELMPGTDGTLSFPITLVDEEVYAHNIGTYTGYLDDIVDLMQVHPMRETSYSTAYNSCQHWAATLLLLLRTFGESEPRRHFSLVNFYRYSSILEVLAKQGSSLYHKPNWYLERMRVMGVGGGAAAMGAAAVAAEATTLVSAGGIAGWFGATVAVPTAGAVVATAALPFTAGAKVVMGGTYLYLNHSWKSSTMFKDPKVHGCPKDGQPLSKVEKGESFRGVGSSSGSLQSGASSPILLGSYVGINAGAISAACSPGAATIIAPSAVVSLTASALAPRRKLNKLGKLKKLGKLFMKTTC